MGGENLKDMIIEVLITTLEQARNDMQLTLKQSDDRTAVHHLPGTIKDINDMLIAVNSELEKLKGIEAIDS